MTERDQILFTVRRAVAEALAARRTTTLLEVMSHTKFGEVHEVSCGTAESCDLTAKLIATNIATAIGPPEGFPNDTVDLIGVEGNTLVSVMYYFAATADHDAVCRKLLPLRVFVRTGSSTVTVEVGIKPIIAV
jgi:hypothetical protein